MVRPRVIILESSKESAAALHALADRIDIVLATSQEHAIALFQQGADGAGLLANDAPKFTNALSADQLLNHLGLGVAVTNSDEKIVWHNQSFNEFTNGQSMLGTHLYSALGVDPNEKIVGCPLRACKESNLASRGRVRFRGARYAEVSVKPLFSPGGQQLDYLVCVVRDATFEVKQREKLNAIHRAGLELTNLSTDELERMSTGERVDLLKANILQYSQKILSFNNLEIRLLDAGTNQLKVLLSEGMALAAGLRELFAKQEGNGVTGFVAATGISYVCDDVRSDPLYIPGMADARSSLTVPLVFRERVIGTFNVESTQPRHFGVADREFLEVFAREIAVALNTLQLLQAEKQLGLRESVQNVITGLGVPIDEILNAASRIKDLLPDDPEKRQMFIDIARRVANNTRSIKKTLTQLGKSLAPSRGPTTTTPIETSFFSGRRVLVVDNDNSVRLAAFQLLAPLGCETDTAGTGREALSLVRDNTYDAILGDIRLPDMNGYELFRHLREASPTTPIVLMTGFGYDASHSLVKARQDGLRSSLYKPFRIERLCEAIADAIDPEAARRRKPSGSLKQVIS